MLALFFISLPVTGTKPRKSQAQNPRWGADLPIEVDLVGSSLSGLVVERAKARTRVQYARGTRERNGRGLRTLQIERKNALAYWSRVRKYSHRNGRRRSKVAQHLPPMEKWRIKFEVTVLSISQFANKVAHPLNYASPPLVGIVPRNPWPRKHQPLGVVCLSELMGTIPSSCDQTVQLPCCAV